MQDQLLGTPNVDRDFEVLSSWASFALPLASFEPGPYVFGLDDPRTCLREVSRLCFGVPLRNGEAASGTLELADLAFE